MPSSLSPLWRGRLRRTLILLADPIVAALVIGLVLAIVAKAVP